MKGCGAVGKVVAPDSRDGQFESSHRQILFTINCITNVLKRRGGNRRRLSLQRHVHKEQYNRKRLLQCLSSAVPPVLNPIFYSSKQHFFVDCLSSNNLVVLNFSNNNNFRDTFFKTEYL